MSTLDRLKLNLKKMLADNFGNVLKKLDQLLKPESPCYNTLLMLTGEFKQWNNRQIQNVQSQEALSQEFNNLNVRLMKLIDSLGEDDVRAAFSLQEEIFEKILVVCKLPERVAYMKKFFPQEYFVNVRYAEPTGVFQSAKGYDIVVFDNEPFDSDDGAHSLLNQYLLEDPLLLCFVKGRLEVLEKFPEKAYATNSVFSLHARLFEMLNYLKYTRAAEPLTFNP